MHKPIRPKSAKGQTRRTHPAIARTSQTTTTSTRQNSTTTQARQSKTTTQAQQNTTTRQSTNTRTTSVFAPGPGSSSRAYQSSATARSLSRSNRGTSHNEIDKFLMQKERNSFSQSKPEPTPPNTEGGENSMTFPEITRPTSSLSKYHILPAISSHQGAQTSTSGFQTRNHGEPDPGRNLQSTSPSCQSPDENLVDLLTEKAQQMILDSARQRLRHKPTSPNGVVKRKVSKTAKDFDSKRQRVHQTKSVFASQTTTNAEKTPEVPRYPQDGESGLLIALKLPDGKRVERLFLPDTSIEGILAYAHSQYPIIPVSQCNVFRMDVIPKKLVADTSKTLNELGIVNRTVLYIEEDEDYI